MTMYQRVGGPKKYVKPKDMTKGDIMVEGKYVGRSPNKFGKENFDFKPAEGPMVSINHAGHLDYLIENYVSPGDNVRVIYDGQSEIESGAFEGKKAHSFVVEMAETDLASKPAVKTAEAAPEMREGTAVNTTPPAGGPVDLSGLD